MVLARGSGDALEAARRLLAARDADLADADRLLTETVAGAYRIAAESIRRIETIATEVEAVTDQPRDSAAGGREVGRHLVAKNRELADVVSEAQGAIEAKTAVLKELTERYRTPSPGG
jgi:hypothetical protein